MCGRRSWRGTADDLTSPGEQAAAALVAIGTRAFQPVLGALHSAVWIARRNAAWALGAFDDQRAVAALIDTLKDREPGVREQAAWALGALDDAGAVQALISALKDPDPRVRRQAAWALGAIDDARASSALSAALTDQDDRTREQAAWALGAIDDSTAVPALLRALTDSGDRVRKQAAWALGAIDDKRAVEGLVKALSDQEQRRAPAGRVGSRCDRRSPRAARLAANAQGLRRQREEAGRLGDWRHRQVRHRDIQESHCIAFLRPNRRNGRNESNSLKKLDSLSLFLLFDRWWDVA